MLGRRKLETATETINTDNKKMEKVTLYTIGAVLVSIFIFFIWHFNISHDLKTTVIVSFFECVIFMIMNLMYIELFTLFAFLFAVVFNACRAGAASIAA
jgi:hypothetical protein